MNTEKIKDYYKQTQFEYRIVWNWKTKNIPALHFGFYDEKATTHDQALIRANEVLAEWAGIPKGARIIDAGCGLGNSSAWLAQHYNAKVTGITIAPNQAEAATKRITEAGINNVDFKVANYLEMPFEDNSVDVVWAVESVCYATDKGAFYKEAFRVLKPAGKIVIADFIRCKRPLSVEKEQLLKDVFGGWAIDDIDTVEEYAVHSSSAGFEHFRYNDVSQNLMVSFRNLEEATKRWYWLAWLLYNTKVISRIRFDNMRYSMKQLECLENGLFFYGHLTAIKP